MLKTRVMPCLLLKDGALVKTIRFKDPAYIGDPVNAIRIYNEKEVDELILLDISSTVEGKPIPFKIIGEIASECFMPVTYGGGIKTLDDIKDIFAAGIEKVAINTQAIDDSNLITSAAGKFGNQSILVSIDVHLNPAGQYEVYTHGGRRATGLNPVDHAVRMEKTGAGEILLTSIDRDGTMEGYDIELLRSVTAAVGIPVIACGGAASVDDFVLAVKQGGASAVAAGSMVVYHGRNRAVLINFPKRQHLEKALG